MVYSGFIRIMPDDLDQRSPDYDSEAKYMTLDEVLDAQADEAERQWREEQLKK